MLECRQDIFTEAGARPSTKRLRFFSTCRAEGRPRLSPPDCIHVKSVLLIKSVSDGESAGPRCTRSLFLALAREVLWIFL